MAPSSLLSSSLTSPARLSSLSGKQVTVGPSLLTEHPSCIAVVYCGVVWSGMLGMVWFSTIWFGIVWSSLLYFGRVWFGMVHFGEVCFGIVLVVEQCVTVTG